MLKKLFLLCCFVVGLMTMGSAEAAPTIKDVIYGVSPDGQLRIVLDTTSAAKYKTERLSKELRVTVYGNLKKQVDREFTPKNAPYVSVVQLERKVNATVVHIKMKDTLERGSYKVFELKADKLNKRPTRVVIDVIAGPPQKKFRPKRPEKPSSSPWTATRRDDKPKFGDTYSVVGGIKGKRIILDPGHGGSDPGTHGLVTGATEKEVTLPVAMKVKSLLESKGAIVYMTRTTDVDVYGPDATDAQELQARVDVAERSRSDLFLSIHVNASVNTSIGGYSTYYYPKTKYDIQVAQCIQDRLMKTAKVDDMGVRSANFYVIKHSSMPGALVECLFFTNKREEQMLISPWFQNKMAIAIADGIEDFYNQHRGG